MARLVAGDPAAARMPALALALLAAAWAGPAAAQNAAPADPQAAARQACRGDFRKHCPDVQPGGGRGLRCLEEHAAALSAPCRAALDAAKQARGRPGG